MSTRLEKINEEIKRIEKRIALQQDQLKGAIQRRKDIENEEIIRSFRTLNLDHKELVSVVNGLQNGTITVEDIRKLTETNGESDKDASAGYFDHSKEVNDLEQGNTGNKLIQIESEGKSE